MTVFCNSCSRSQTMEVFQGFGIYFVCYTSMSAFLGVGRYNEGCALLQSRDSEYYTRKRRALNKEKKKEANKESNLSK